MYEKHSEFGRKKGLVFRILAAVCFLALGIIAVGNTTAYLDGIKSIIKWGVDLQSLCVLVAYFFFTLVPVGYVLLGLAAVLDKRVFAPIGAAICAAGNVFNTLAFLNNAFTNVPMILVWVLLVMIFYSRGKRCWSYAVGVVVCRLLNLLAIIVQYGGDAIAFKTILIALLLIAGAFLVAAAYTRRNEMPRCSAGAYSPAHGENCGNNGAFCTDRGLLKYILLSIVTFGIYGIVVMSQISTEVNIIASRYDGKKTTHYCLMYFLFSWLTLGIAPFVWFHKLSNRIGAELERRNVCCHIDASTFWLWGVLGSFIVVGPFVYYHKLFNAMNHLAAHHNLTC